MIVTDVYLFPNGNICVIGFRDEMKPYAKEQIGELQGVFSIEMLREIIIYCDNLCNFHGFFCDNKKDIIQKYNL